MRTTRFSFSLAVAIFLALLEGGAVLAASEPTGEELRREAKELTVQYAADLKKLVLWCQEQGLATEARKTRDAQAGRQDPYKLYLPLLPKQVGPPKLPQDMPGPIVEWQGRFLKLRQAYAEALFDLALRAIRTRRASLAYQFVQEAIHADPDHEGARRVFGYQKYEGQWRTPYEIKKLSAGLVWHDKFGWIKEAYVQRYEKGERYTGLRWITAEADARQHRDIRSGWVVETEHYRIRTNHSLEVGVALGAKLETLYRLWQQVFVCYGTTEAAVEALFAGRTPARRADAQRFDVTYYRTRDQYDRALQAAIPEVGITQGMYIAKDRMAYFFAGAEDPDRILYHEATHQLFQQSRRVPPNVGQRANFWIVEGIAMYMESLRQENGYYVLGGLDDVRMISARYHVFEQQFYVPFERLTALGMQRLQNQPKLAKLYSQMAAQTSFLVYYDNARYRDALVAYLAAVYSGNDDPAVLSELTGASYSQLDKQYREYMKIGKEE